MAKDQDVCSEQRVGNGVRDDGVRNLAASVLRDRVEHPGEDASDPTPLECAKSNRRDQKRGQCEVLR